MVEVYGTCITPRRQVWFYCMKFDKGRTDEGDEESRFSVEDIGLPPLHFRPRTKGFLSLRIVKETLMSSLQNIPAETVETINFDSIATPPCHDLTANQDSLTQTRPSTSSHINNLDMGWRNASHSISQRHPA
ncbi:hypothetical protein TNCV_1524621 [Trichonephila clavipes]|nr:hypothetical protein TNCV_1524621 [Trichonephila clavipes]